MISLVPAFVTVLTMFVVGIALKNPSTTLNRGRLAAFLSVGQLCMAVLALLLISAAPGFDDNADCKDIGKSTSVALTVLGLGSAVVGGAAWGATARASAAFVPLVAAQALIVPYAIFLYWLLKVGCSWN